MREQEIYNDMPIENPKSNQAKCKKKKNKLKRFLLIIAILIFVWWFNNYTLRTTEYTVYSNKIANSIRIAVISDLHASNHGISNERIVEEIEESNPDLVFMLGDMYTRKSEWEKIEIPIQLASMITEREYPLYFVPGEHDTSQQYFTALSNVGVHVMNYKSEIIDVNGNNVQILGIDNAYFSETFNLNNAFTLEPNCYSILMAHIPNYDAYSAFGTDLTICGDTHGGIIQLPFNLGPAYDSAAGEWFPEITGQREDIYDKGIFSYNGGNMIITSGIGNHPFPARINNRPEIAVIDIMPA